MPPVASTAVSTAGTLRVGHAFVRPGEPLSMLTERVARTGWEMVELDVLRAADGRLLVAHDPGDLARGEPVLFADALAELAALLPAAVRVDVDVKATGDETEIADAIAASGMSSRVLLSTMHLSSLRVLRAHAPALALGLSVPLARRDHLRSRWTRPGAHVMLAVLRRVLPRRVGRVLDRGEADAVMAHWGVLTPALVRAVRGRGGELFVWTVDDAERLRTVERHGVSGIISNRWELFAAASKPDPPVGGAGPRLGEDPR